MLVEDAPPVELKINAELLEAIFEDCKLLQDQEQMRQVINVHRGLKYYGKYLYKDDDEAQTYASLNEVVREALL